MSSKNSSFSLPYNFPFVNIIQQSLSYVHTFLTSPVFKADFFSSSRKPSIRRKEKLLPLYIKRVSGLFTQRFREKVLRIVQTINFHCASAEVFAELFVR